MSLGIDFSTYHLVDIARDGGGQIPSDDDKIMVILAMKLIIMIKTAMKIMMTSTMKVIMTSTMKIIMISSRKICHNLSSLDGC